MEQGVPSGPTLDITLDVFGQQPSLFKLYTQISLIFPLPQSTPDDFVIERLAHGIRKLQAAIPWTGGTVARSDTGSDGSTYRIRARSEKEPFQLRLRDYRSDEDKSFDALERAKWPIRMLDESWLCPRNTLGMLDKETEATVFEVQASFVRGGVIVSFAGQHNVLDMTGLAQIIRLFDKACRDEPFTGQELASGNSLSSVRVPLFGDDWQISKHHTRYATKARIESPSAAAEGVAPTAAESVAPTATWAYFNFSAQALGELKITASKDKLRGVDYITTDDALTALIWASVSRARSARMSSKDRVTTLGRAIDPRTFVGLAPDFPGLVMNMTYHDASYEFLSTAPIGAIASELRAALDPKSSQLRNTTQTLATLLSRDTERQGISVTAQLDLSKDVALSSWSKFEFSEFDFGLGLGLPIAVRRPRFSPMEGLMYLLPKTRDGSIALTISLRDEDMALLKSDQEFTLYGEYIG